MNTAKNGDLRSDVYETAIFGGGCFWCLEAVFRQVVGVESVVSGYCGGYIPNPDYRQVCSGETGHAEVVKVVFDPQVLDYRTVLEIFFATHDPTTLNQQGHDIGTQYRSVIFTRHPNQKQIALALIDELDTQGVFPDAIVTEVEERNHPFWPAEEEHQEYFFNHAEQPYCQYVITPKLSRFRERFANFYRQYR